jgi:hypothetical protein
MADGSQLPEIRVGSPIVEDFAHIARHLRQDERMQYLALTGLAEYVPDVAARAFAATSGPQFVMVARDGLPVLAGGFAPVRRGVFEGWLVGTDEGWAKYWRAMTKVCRGLMDDLLTTGGAHRVETFAVAGREHAHEWYERSLLMHREGTMKGYFCDGQDAIVFARVNA